MNEQMLTDQAQAKVNETLVWLMDAVRATGDVVVAEAPGVVREVVAYGRFCHSAALVFAVVLCVVAIRLGRFAMFQRDRAVRDGDEGAFMLLMMGFAGCVMSAALSISIACSNFSPMAKAWLAPRLYVLEWLGRML